MPNEFSPRNLAQPLKPREAKRFRRHTLPPVDRMTPWPVDNDAMWRARWRKEAIYSTVLGVIWLAWFVFLIYMVISQPSAGQMWRF